MANDMVIIDKAEIDGFRADGSSSIDHAKELARGIKDASTLDAAAKFMLAAKDRIKRITDRFKGPKADARKSWQDWIDLENELIEPYQRIEREILKPAMAAFQVEQDRKRREEEARIYAERKRAEEEAKLAAAQKAEEAGQPAMADAILESPVMVAPAVVPQVETPRGISYRDVWRYRVTDLAQVPREYLVLNEQKVGGVVRALKGETRIPGVEVYSEKVVAGRV